MDTAPGKDAVDEDATNESTANATANISINAATWRPGSQQIVVMTSDGRLLRSDKESWKEISHGTQASTIAAARQLTCNSTGNRLLFANDSVLNGYWLMQDATTTYASSQSFPSTYKHLEASPDGDAILACFQFIGLAVYSNDGRMRWNTFQDSAVDPDYRHFIGRFHDTSLAWTDADELLVASRSARLQRWSSEGQLLQQYVTSHHAPQTLIRLKNDSFMVVSEKCLMMEWDVPTNSRTLLETPPNTIVQKGGLFRLNLQEDCIAFTDGYGVLKLIDLNIEPVEIKSIPAIDQVMGIEWHESLDQICVSRRSGLGVQVLERDGTLRKKYEVTLQAPAAWIPGTESLLIPTLAGNTTWDSETDETTETPYGKGTPVFSDFGHRLLIVGDDLITLWYPHNRTELWSAALRLDPFTVTFSSDNALLAAMIRDTDAAVVLDGVNGHLRWCLLTGDQEEAIVIDGNGALVTGTAERLDRRARLLLEPPDLDSEVQSVLELFDNGPSLDPEVAP